MTHLSITLILVVILQIIRVSKRSSYVFFMHVWFLMSKHKAHGVPQGRWGLLPPCKTLASRSPPLRQQSQVAPTGPLS